MKYLKNKCFQRELKNFGFKMYKIRGAKEGKGKSGGFRNIFFWKKDELIVFCLLFAKNEQDNLSSDDQKALRIWSNEYGKLTENEIKKGIEKKIFGEIEYVKKLQ